MWRHPACDVIMHVTSSCMWRHHACDVIMHVTSSCMWRHHACDVIMHVTSSCMWRHAVWAVILHVTSPCTWRHASATFTGKSVSWLLRFYILERAKVISGLVPTVIVFTHGDFMVLAHWETTPPASGNDIPLSHIILTLSQPVLAFSYWSRLVIVIRSVTRCLQWVTDLK